MKRALVCGAGGFIGGHLVKHLKERGYWVRGVDIKPHEYCKTEADEFLVGDLSSKEVCDSVVDESIDEVYQLAADMGGMGFIHSAECEIMTNSALINIHMINAAADKNIKKYFFASSACVYPNQELDDPPLTEEDVYPAFPDNEYGWEKLYAERMALSFARNLGIEVKIARFQNCFGPEGTWNGGREKAPAAICRKVASVNDGGSIDVWGDGTAVRNFIYVDDLCRAILMLMNSDIEVPINIGTDEIVTVNDLVNMVIDISGKRDIKIVHVDGPVGVIGRYETFDKLKGLGWKPNYTIEDGMKITYEWIKEQVENESIHRNFN